MRPGTLLGFINAGAPAMRKTPPTATDTESSIAETAMSAVRVRRPESLPTVRTVAAGVATARDAKRPERA